MESLTEEPWFHGVLDRQVCNDILWNSPFNSWLVRVSSSTDRYIISKLCVEEKVELRYTVEPSRSKSVVEPLEKKIKHFIIHEASDGNFYMTKGICFRNLPLLVEYYLKNPILTENEPSTLPFLNGPMARQIQMRKEEEDDDDDDDEQDEDDNESERWKSAVASVSDESPDDEEESQDFFSTDDEICEDQKRKKTSINRGLVQSPVIEPTKMPEAPESNELFKIPKRNSFILPEPPEEFRGRNEARPILRKTLTSSGTPLVSFDELELEPEPHSNASEEGHDAPTTSQRPVNQLECLLTCELRQCSQEIAALRLATSNLTMRLEALSHNVQIAVQQLTGGITANESGVIGGPGFVPNPGTLLRAIQAYSPNYFDELNLNVGDRITFLDQIEPGWWRGKSNSRVGLFPSSMVVIVDERNTRAIPERVTM